MCDPSWNKDNLPRPDVAPLVVLPVPLPERDPCATWSTLRRHGYDRVTALLMVRDLPALVMAQLAHGHARDEDVAERQIRAGYALFHTCLATAGIGAFDGLDHWFHWRLQPLEAILLANVYGCESLMRWCDLTPASLSSVDLRSATYVRRYVEEWRRLKERAT